MTCSLGREVQFSSGKEAANLLYAEAARRDPHQPEFLQAVDEVSCPSLT